MVAICLNSRNYRLTVGASYDVLRTNGNNIIIVNDNNSVVQYSRELFRIEENVNNTTAPQTRQNATRPVEPVAIPTPVEFTEADRIRSIRVETSYNDSVFTINYLYNNKQFVESDDDIRSGTLQIGLVNSSISCGIVQLFGFNTAGISIITSIDYTRHDNESLTSELFQRISESLSAAISESFDAGMRIMASDIQNSHGTRILENCFRTVESFRNPNSGNNVVLYIKTVE